MNQHPQSYREVIQKKIYNKKKVQILTRAGCCKWLESLSLRHNFSFLQMEISKCLKTLGPHTETVSLLIKSR